jgi:GNAT superfamily N-acetyltransferase
VNLIEITPENVAKKGFFCRMSKAATTGNKRKLVWLKDRFAEGLRIEMLTNGGRGFVETIPGEHAWRAVEAEGYLFIHCLWIVGKTQGRGDGSMLLKRCLEDARAKGMRGVCVLCSENVWLVGRSFFEKHGFVAADAAAPAFTLMVKSFSRTAPPRFATEDWAARAKRFGPGVTVIRTDQCPYIEDAAQLILEVASERGLAAKEITFEDRKTLCAEAPTPYGTFAVVFNGTLLSYHYLTRKDLIARLDAAGA